MSVPEFKSDLATPDPDIEALAAIGDLDGEIISAMQAWTGIPNLFEDPDSYQYGVGAMMIAMTQMALKAASSGEWRTTINS